MTPNDRGKLDIDLYGDLGSILSLAAEKNRLLRASEPLFSGLTWLRRTILTANMPNSRAGRDPFDGATIFSTGNAGAKSVPTLLGG